MVDSQRGSKKHYTNNLKCTYKSPSMVNELQKEYAVPIQLPCTMTMLIMMNIWT